MWKSSTPHYIRLHSIYVQFSTIHQLTIDVCRSCFNFKIGFKVWSPSRRAQTKFFSQKVLHKQDMKSFAYRGLQSGLMSPVWPSSSLPAWLLGSPQVFLRDHKKTWRSRLVTPPNMSFTCYIATNANQVVFSCQKDYTSLWFTAESRILTKCYISSSVWLRNISNINSNSFGLDLIWFTTVELYWTVFRRMTYIKVLKKK